MSDVSSWSPSAGSNTSAPPDGFPEGQSAPSVNNSAREVMAAVRRWYDSPEFRSLSSAYTVTRASASQVRIANIDQTAIYTAGLRVRVTDGATTVSGFVTGSTLAAPDTIVDIKVDGGTAIPAGANSITASIVPSLSPLAYIPAVGPDGPTAGTEAQVDYLTERDSGASLPALMGDFYTSEVGAYLGYSSQADAALATAGEPWATLAVLVESNNANKDAAALWAMGIASDDNDSAIGGHFVVTSAAAVDPATMRGVLVDFAPLAGTAASAGSAGVDIVKRGDQSDAIGVLIRSSGFASAEFATGIRIDDANVGFAANTTATLATLIDTGNGAAYTGPTILVRNEHTIRFEGTGGTPKHVNAYHDSTNDFRVTVPNGSIVIRNNVDTNDLLSFSSSGVLTVRPDLGSDGVVIQGGEIDIPATTGAYKIAGTKVIGQQVTGWDDFVNATWGTSRAEPAGGSFSGWTTGAQVTFRILATLIQDLRSHGVIGS